MAYIEYVHAHPTAEAVAAGLRDALRFSAADLESNREGKIGPDQRNALIGRVVLPPLFALGAGIAVSIALRVVWAGFAEQRNIVNYAFTLLGDVVTCNLTGLYGDYVRTGGEDIPRFVRAALMIPIGWSLLHVRKGSWEALLDLIKGAGEAEGPAEIVVEEKVTKKIGVGKDEENSYYLQVNQERFGVNTAMKDRVIFGQHYRVYFARGSRTVLSAEPVSPSVSESLKALAAAAGVGPSANTATPGSPDARSNPASSET